MLTKTLKVIILRWWGLRGIFIISFLPFLCCLDFVQWAYIIFVNRKGNFQKWASRNWHILICTSPHFVQPTCNENLLVIRLRIGRKKREMDTSKVSGAETRPQWERWGERRIHSAWLRQKLARSWKAPRRGAGEEGSWEGADTGTWYGLHVSLPGWLMLSVLLMKWVINSQGDRELVYEINPS